MSTRDLIDPELLPLIDMLPTYDIDAVALPMMRSMTVERLHTTPGTLPSAIVAVPGSNGAPDVPVRIFRPAAPAAKNLPAILHIHGGGFVLGCAAMNDTANAARAERHGAVVVSVDYRLAPETPFPGPLEDCFMALSWLFDQTDALGIDPTRIVVAGESAGGGLAAALALLARDRDTPRLAGQVLTYPMLDPASGRSTNAGTGEFVWTRGSSAFGWESMRGGQDIPADRLHHFAPGQATDLGNVAPAFIAVGALDLFLDEDLAFAAALANARVAVELHVYPGAFHGFDLMPGSAVGRRMEADIAIALDRFFADPRSTP